MKIQVSFKPTIIIALLFAIMALNTFSILLLTSLDRVVSIDLYAYGLLYSEAWATVYRQYLYLTTISITISMSIAGFSILSVLIYTRTRKREFSLASYGLLTSSAVTTGASIFFLGRLDHVVHSDLYRYGLVFDYQWANKYWTYARLTLGLDALAIAIAASSIALIYLGSRTQVKITGTKAFCYILSVIGIIALGLSIYSDSQILALIGLGLTFWGILLAYIAGEEYVKKTVSEAATLSPLTALNEMLTELNYNGSAVYLPPKYLENLEDNKAYIAKDMGVKLCMPEQAMREKSVFVKEPDAVLITPPGDGLTKLFERHLGMSFAKADLSYLEENLSRLLVEDFEIAEDFKILIKNSVAYVTIKGSAYNDVFEETAKSSTKTNPFGCPVSSALACILAKASGKPIITSKEQVSQDGRIIVIEYRLLDELEAGSSQ